MDIPKSLKSKTVWTGITAVIGALAGYLTGEISLEVALQAGLTGLIAIFMRQGIEKNGPAVIALILMPMIAFTGCTNTSLILKNKPPDQTCVICDISAQMTEATGITTTPEDLFQVITLSNLVALENDLYSANDAQKVIAEAIAKLKYIKQNKQSITYMQIIEFVQSKYKLMSPKAQMVMSVIDPLQLKQYKVDIPLSGYDIEILLKHLSDQQQIVMFYL